LNRHDADNQLRTAAYEVLNAFVTNAANDSVGFVATLSNVILERLEKTIQLQQQVVSVEDKLTLEEMQTSLTSVVMVRFLKLLYGQGIDIGIGNRSTARGRNQAAG
jgi:importin subunit beta-1